MTPTPVKEFQDTLWKAADKLRGSMDASQYKDIVLGLVFLKYVTDAFDARREELRAELEEDGASAEDILEDLEDRDAYLEKNVFWVAETARWDYLKRHSKGKTEGAGGEFKSIGKLIDEAAEALMADNPSLEGTLQRNYNSDSVDQHRLGELIDLFSTTRFTAEGPERARDLLGEVYEYFLARFASAEGKRGGEFYLRVPWCVRLWRFSNRPRAASTTRAAAQVACSSRQKSSSTHTTRTRLRLQFTARRTTN